jgi:hypothetical protein
VKRQYLTTIFVVILSVIPSLVSAASLPSTLLIDEFRTSSTAATNYSYDEYIVVKNYGSLPVDITGYCIYKRTAGTVKTPSKPELIFRFDKYILQSEQSVTIGGPSYTGSSFLPYNGTATLADSENVILLYPKTFATGLSDIDSVTYGKNVIFSEIEGTALANPERGVPYKRVGFPENNDNSLDFELYIAEIPAAPVDPNSARIVISELMPAPASSEEWFELFNPTSLTVSLSGIKVCDAVGSVHCYYFPESEVLAPFSYKTYAQSVTKITMNNTGDWLELRDGSDNLISDSGGNYGNAETNISLSLFGSEFMWTKTATPGTQNIFVDTIEIEETSTTTPKSTSKKVKTASSVKTSIKTVPSSPISDEVISQAAADKPTVKGVSVASQSNVGTKTLGYALISLAVLLLLGYNLWEKRDYAKKLYDKISRRND